MKFLEKITGFFASENTVGNTPDQAMSETSAAHLSALMDSGLALIKDGNLPLALAQFEKVLALSPRHFDAQFQRAYVLKDLHRTPEALLAFEQALAIRPDELDALNGRALVLVDMARYDEALKAYDQILTLQPDYIKSRTNRARLFLHLQKYAETLADCERVLQQQPDFVPALNCYARAQQLQGNAVAALDAYEKILAIAPQHVDALCQSGFLLLEQSQPAQALERLTQAQALLRSDENSQINSQISNARGMAFAALEQYEAALTCYGHALNLSDSLARTGILANIGRALFSLKRIPQAHDAFEEAVRLAPDSLEAYANRGWFLHKINQHERALADFNLVLAQQPDNKSALVNSGFCQTALGKNQEAIECCEKILQFYSDDSDALGTLGVIHLSIGNMDLAEAYLERAKAGNPVLALWNLSHLQLKKGNFKSGWENYEVRWSVPGFYVGVPPTSFPGQRLQTSEQIPHKTLLIYAEQGFGDTIQFCRYAIELARQAGKVILMVQPPLKSLLASLPADVTVIGSNEPVPHYDFFSPMLSIPGIVGTELETIPALVPYLRADPGAVARWGARLSECSGRPRVGIVWSGNPEHGNDRNRSMSLKALLPLIRTGVQLVSLQRDVRPEDEQTLAEHPEILNLGRQLDDFADTAALIEQMDLVLSVCTSVAHLAGALGKPVWLMLPAVVEWRWLTDRNDSPWYPTARLFRQNRAGDWSNVVEEISICLEQRFECSPQSGSAHDKP